MSDNPLEKLSEWVAWASGEIDARFQKAKWHTDEGRKALAEEEMLIGNAMLDLMSGFKRMVLDDDRRTDQERTGTEDQ